jgi:DNA repair exonuclease SbcCD ATPase subunit
MLSSQVIEKELKALLARREALAGDAKQARQVLEATRAEFIKAKVEASALANAQSTSTAFDDSVRALDEQIEALRPNLTSARAREQEQANARRLTELRAARVKVQADFDALRAEANAFLTETIKRVLEVGNRWSATNAEMQKLAPGSVTPSSGQLQHVPLEYGEAVNLAIQTGYRRVDKERQRAFVRRRALA